MDVTTHASPRADARGASFGQRGQVIPLTLIFFLTALAPIAR